MTICLIPPRVPSHTVCWALLFRVRGPCLTDGKSRFSRAYRCSRPALDAQDVSELPDDWTSPSVKKTVAEAAEEEVVEEVEVEAIDAIVCGVGPTRLGAEEAGVPSRAPEAAVPSQAPLVRKSPTQLRRRRRAPPIRYNK